MMNQISMKSPDLRKYMQANQMLAIVSFICMGISIFFGSYNWSVLWLVLNFLLIPIPSLLWILYLFQFYKKMKASKIIIAMFAVFSFTWLLGFICDIKISYEALSALPFPTRRAIWWFSIGLEKGSEFLGYWGGAWETSYWFRERFIFIELVACVLVLISVLWKGFHKNKFIMIALSLGCMFELSEIITILLSIGSYFSGEEFSLIINSLGIVALYTSMLVFWFKIKDPTAIVYAKSKRSSEKMTPESELKLLKEQMELDMITEEEYQAKRAEIISRL